MERRFALLPAFVTLICLVLGALPASASPGSADWSRVLQLKRNATVVVRCAGQAAATGKIVAVSEDAITLLGTGGRQAIARDQVIEVRVEKNGRRWYSIPAAVAAGAGGAAVSYAIGRHGTCNLPNADCESGRGLLLFAIPAGAAALAYRATLGTTSQVIYQAPPPPVSFVPEWESLRKGLPPSLRGR